MTLRLFALYAGTSVSITVLIALLVCLIPTTIGALLSAIGIAGIDRLLQRNVVAPYGRAVEAAGDVDSCSRTRPAHHAQQPAGDGVPARRRCDDGPDSQSRLTLEPRRRDSRGPLDRGPGQSPGRLGRRRSEPDGVTFVPFSATTRMSGVDSNGTSICKGAADSVAAWAGQPLPKDVRTTVETIARSGGTPLVVAESRQVLGTIHLKDIVKPGIADRFSELRRMGLRSVMTTGDNRLTAATIAKEAGVDDFLADATPEDKLELIRAEQSDAVWSP